MKEICIYCKAVLREVPPFQVDKIKYAICPKCQTEQYGEVKIGRGD